MFTGIVTDIGEIVTLNQQNGASGLTAALKTAYMAETIAIGASIACDGVCLTVVKKETTGTGSIFTVDISPETLSKTNLAQWVIGKKINLERALKIGDELGGHIVSGHVDGLAEVIALEHIGDNTVYSIQTPPELSRFIAEKGSVTLNGVSLTVNKVEGDVFEINVIPHTKLATTWQEIKLNDKLNLEVDTLARYVARLKDYDSAK